MGTFTVLNLRVALPTVEQRVLARQYYRFLRTYVRRNDAVDQIADFFRAAGTVVWRESIPQGHFPREMSNR